ncbi:glycoside hydrolase family 10 protein [Rubrivirga sp.]|uniref:glycoside hydrolase family 10 protein n=1 Tax=Rubrivirga sp. TaxID=1885344 RepID=UPI003C72FB54
MTLRPFALATLLTAGAFVSACSGADPIPEVVTPPPVVVTAAPDTAVAPEPEPAEPYSGEIVSSSTLPGPDREFRAAWIATVANIDWPTRADLEADEQRAELIALLDRAVEVGLNAIVLQVRPMGDALYYSPNEPWSAFLTGEEAVPPSPWYDPLTFAVREAHARGLELHAWFNPYRAGHPASIGRRDITHISRQRPDLIRRYGDQVWLDPGEPDAVDHSMEVIMDVVRRYDIDGVHIDDYFYPYPINRNGRRVQFPDADSYARALEAGETLGRDDWRRQNVDLFIERMYREVKDIKPHVKVGVSPFGIWRPGYPETVRGFDQYGEIYADARKWWREGTLDYLAPQLYWSIDSDGQSFPALLEWWASENASDRHLWPGLYTSRLLPDVGGYDDDEIPSQVRLVQDLEGATGTIHFSMKALVEGVTSAGAALEAGPYAEPALVPASPWIEDDAPEAPLVRVTPRGDALDVLFSEGGPERARHYVVRARRGGEWSWQVVQPDVGTMVLDRTEAGAVEAVAVSVVDRVGNEGPARVLEVALLTAEAR